MINRIKKFLIKEKKPNKLNKEFSKQINKLKEIDKQLILLESKSFDEGVDKLLELRIFIKRWICRVYPENDKKDFILYSREIFADKKHFDGIKILRRTIKTIINEFEVFGFDDFKPVKEKIELSGQIGYGSNKLKAKKIIEKER